MAEQPSAVGQWRTHSSAFERAARALREGAWAERIVESRRAPRWQFSTGLTCGEQTMDALWADRLARDVSDREGHVIVVARQTARDRVQPIAHKGGQEVSDVR